MLVSSSSSSGISFVGMGGGNGGTGRRGGPAYDGVYTDDLMSIGAVVELDTCAHGLRKLAANREPQADSAGRRRREGLKQTLTWAVAEPGPGIRRDHRACHQGPTVAAGGPGGHGLAGVPSGGGVADRGAACRLGGTE